MSLKTEQFVAVYLIGGPGSGKDAVLHNTILNKKPIVEISLDKLHKAILETKDVAEINEGEPLVVNGNADDAQKILLTKKVLESVGYKTLALFVYTTDEVSKTRNEQRIKLGAKTFSEDHRAKKYKNSIDNLKLFQENFSSFLIFNNSNNLLNEETQAWLIELNAELSKFMSKDEIDKEVEIFLEGKENEYYANQTLAQTARTKTVKQISGNDYFSHNEIKNRPKTNKSQDKIPVPPHPANVGPSHKFTEEKKPSFKNFTKKTAPPVTSGHADGGNGMIATETVKKPVKPPYNQFGIRPDDGVGSASNPLAAESKKITKKPSDETDAREGDDMAGVETIGEVQKSKIKPIKTSQVAKTENQGQQQATTAVFSTESKSLSQIRSRLINRSPAEVSDEPIVYEDWGIESEEVLFEGRVVKTNKPFKRQKKHAVYVKDGADVRLLTFERKGTITLQENIKPTDVRFWETKR